MEETSTEVVAPAACDCDTSAIESALDGMGEQLQGISDSLDAVNTAIAGQISVDIYTLFALVLSIGVLLFVVFSITMRRF